MYYSQSQGVQSMWRDRFLTVINQLRERNLLPAVVVALIIVWIALIIIGFQQTILKNPQVPDNTRVGAGSGTNLSVTDAATVASTQNNGGSTGTATIHDMNTVMQQALTSSQVASGADSLVSGVGDVIGGKGGDGGTSGASGAAAPVTGAVNGVVDAVTDPVVDTVNSLPLPVSVGSDDNSTDASVNLTLPATPVTNQLPINANVSLPVSLGGLL